MVINTKFNIGDKVFTVNKETMKAEKITISGVMAYSYQSGAKGVKYQKQEEVVSTTFYEEELCFTSMDELVAHIAAGIEE